MPHEAVGDLGDASGTVIAGAQRPGDPAAQDFWAASTAGAGEQTLRWDVTDGNWRAVVMAQGGTRSVQSEMAVGAQLPDLLGVSLALIGGGAVLLALGAVALVAGVRGGGR